MHQPVWYGYGAAQSPGDDLGVVYNCLVCSWIVLRVLGLLSVHSCELLACRKKHVKTAVRISAELKNSQLEVKPPLPGK